MPVQKGNAGFAQRMGAKLKTAHETHKADETVYSAGGNLPPGIESGIAQLVTAGFGIYKEGVNKGKDFFRAAGVVLQPKMFTDAKDNIHRLEGKQTSIMIPMCDTKSQEGKVTSFDDHYARLLNELRKLGLNTAEIDADNIESSIEALVQSEVVFGFRTWASKPTDQYPNPRTNETWEGKLDNYVPDGDDGVQDDTAAAPTPKATTNGASPKSSPKAAPAAKEDVPFGDKLDMLVDKSDNNEEAAQKELTDLALAAGYSEDEIGNSENWAAVAEMARNPKAGDAGDAAGDDGSAVDLDALAAAADNEADQEAADQLTAIASEHSIDVNDYGTWAEAAEAVKASMGGGEEEFKPEKGGTYLYKPPGAKKAVECEVTAVFEGPKTVNLKNLDDGKFAKGVAWDKLEQHS